jgi:hypothetical protein
MQSEHLVPLTRFKDCPAYLQKQLEGFGSPFHNSAFFNILETSGCVTLEQGWQPHHIVFQFEGADYFLPGYLKYHSYGEYIFDWLIADAVSNAGLRYYPKWVMQYPFTPIQMVESLPERVQAPFIKSLKDYFTNQNLLTAQFLYIPETWVQCFVNAGALIRQSIFFLWRNRNYRDWQDFVSELSAKRAKECRRERQKILQSDYSIERLTGSAITEEIIKEFYPLYQHTYRLRSGHSGYLNYAFFREWLLSCKDQVLLVTARRAKELIASALMLFNSNTLYGRYWGSYDRNSGLHFECCYYQGIEFCIERRLQYFNPGVQGEHKVRRGFEPFLVSSAYFYFEPSIKDAVAHYFNLEQTQLDNYLLQLKERLPFRRPVV